MITNTLQAVNSTQTMSSREIADVTEKNHRHVKRDIETMCEQMNWSVSKFGHTYSNPQNKQEYTEYLLPRYECEVLITGYDVQRRAAIIKRWYDLESGSTPSLIPSTQVNSLDSVQQIVPIYKAMLDIAESIGNDLNPLAVRATEKLTGLNLYDLFGEPPSRKGEYLQLDLASDEPDEPVSPPENQAKPPQNRKSTIRKKHTKRQLREKNKYNLDDFFSIRELGEELKRSTGFVREVLMKQRVIKHIQRGNDPRADKYVMTDRGWTLGLMYDPSTKQFHDRSSKRITTSNCQPVFTDEVLKFF